MMKFSPFFFLCVGSLVAGDWPQWRYDAGRSGASPETLPAELAPSWERDYGAREPVWDDPLNHDLMPYDRLFEPVAMGGRLFIGFNDRDKLVALDLETGAELWSFYTGGPLRLPAVCHEGLVIFGSDDGFLYAVAAADGELRWRRQLAPSARKAFGNRRLISAWPVRGGPVVKDGKLYVAASIWPFMGTFIYALDAASGEVLWVNDGTGADFIKQPHSAPSFAGVAPQGALVVSGQTLLVPGGRSVPAGFDLASGGLRFFHLNEGGKGNGGSFVIANENSFFVHTRERGVKVYDLKSGKAGKSEMNEPVLFGGRHFTAALGKKDEPVVRELGTSEKLYWEIAADGSGDLIKAGDHLIAAGKATVTGIRLPKKEKDQAEVSWTLPVDGQVERLLAADGKLIGVTVDGRILVWGEKPGAGKLKEHLQPLAAAPEALVAQAAAWSKGLDDPGGLALVYAPDSMDWVDALLAGSDLQVTVVEPDATQVEAQRGRYDTAGLYGTRVTVQVGDPLSFAAPPYVAGLVVLGSRLATGERACEMVRAAYQSVRPYGGRLQVQGGDDWVAVNELEGAVRGGAALVREGKLPGAADWTHQYGDMANTVKSDDARVKAPLGILWFGGSSNRDVLPRHGHGPPEQVVGGRLFIEGMNSLSARDVYTGRVLWRHDFGDLGTFGIYYNETYFEAPLDTAYNQKHIPGANGRGTNFVATEDAVYIALHGECQVLDARSGKLRLTIPLRAQKGADAAQWGYVGVYEDCLIGGDDFAHFSLKLGGAKSRSEAQIEDLSASAGLVVFDRHSGEDRWRVKARHSFLHNGIVVGNGRIYCLDKLTKYAEDLLKRRGRDLPKDYRIVAFDVHTGQQVWEKEAHIFGTWLGYSAKQDLLLQAGSKASDRLASEIGTGMVVYGGADGKVRWQDLKRDYTGPCILHNELILTGANSYSNSGGAFLLLTGEPHLVLNPLTGNMEPWRLNRTYGCNTIIASEHLLTFRSGAAGFYDLESMSGTGNLGGFKSGCTSNLVVANGVLNAPDYTRTCSCAYQNQTSLALVHMPEIEMWTYSQFGLDGEEGQRVLQAGINFGAPGNRRAEDGTLWLEHPHAVGGIAPRVVVEGLADRATYFRRHSSQVGSGDSPAWVAASGLTGEGEIVIRPALIKPFLEKPTKKTDDGDAGGDREKTDDEKVADAKLGSGKKESPVKPVDTSVRRHKVRLHFSDPGALPPGARVFSVALQGEEVLTEFDLAFESREPGGTLVKEFTGVEIGAELRIGLKSSAGSEAPPVLNGVEFVAED